LLVAIASLFVWMSKGSSIWGSWRCVVVHQQCYCISPCQWRPAWHNTNRCCICSAVDGIWRLRNPASCSDVGFSMHGNHAV